MNLLCKNSEFSRQASVVNSAYSDPYYDVYRSELKDFSDYIKSNNLSKKSQTFIWEYPQEVIDLFPAVSWYVDIQRQDKAIRDAFSKKLVALGHGRLG